MVDFTRDELLAVRSAVAEQYEILQTVSWERRPDLEEASQVLESALDKLYQ